MKFAYLFDSKTKAEVNNQQIEILLVQTPHMAKNY